MEKVKIPKRILGTLLNSLGSGVVPRVGLEYVAIGRNDEISAVVNDLDNISEGMSACRFIIGKYGSGKSFLIGLIRSNAIGRGFVCADADLSPERRFIGTKGQGIATYRELIKNLSVKEYPDSGALEGIISGWLGDMMSDILASGQCSADSPQLGEVMTKRIWEILKKLRGFVNGFDFVKVVDCYFRGYIGGDEELKQDSLKWLRGEFSTKLEARSSSLGVNSIIDDTNWYDYIKLYAVFFRHIGYKGFLVFFDECVNLYKIANRVSRENNYEKILSMFNDTMQGKAESLGVFFGGTPQFMEDNRRGLFSYEALKSRLESGRFTRERRDMTGPVIRLLRLSDDELFALLTRLRTLHSSYYSYSPRLSDDELLAFLSASLGRIGADELITPREITRDFLGVLNVMMQEPDCDFEKLIGQSASLSEKNEEDDGDDGLDIPELTL